MYVQPLNLISRHALCAGLAVLTLLAAGHARADEVSLEELRSTLIRAAELSSRMAPANIPSTRALEMAPPEVLEVLRDSMSNPGELALSVDRLEAAMVDAQVGTAAPSALQALALLSTDQINRGDPDPLDPPKPAYPESPGGVGPYNTFTATLSGLGALVDSDGDSRLNDERCGADYEADLQIGYSAIGSLDAILAGCSALPPGAEDVCFGVAAITAGTAFGFQIAISQCALQDALVDSAEIEAAFENTVIIFDKLAEVQGTVNSSSSVLSAHAAELSSGIDLLANLLRMTLTQIGEHDTAIKNALAAHDGEVKAVLTVHDTDIKNVIGAHDAAVQSRLEDVQSGVDTNTELLQVVLERQLEVIRLLHTPQGQRESDVPACGGGPCTWNGAR